MTGSDRCLRPARGEDAPAIATIWREGWRDAHLGLVPRELVAARDDASFERRAVERIDDATVAAVDGRVAGFIMIAGDELEQLYVEAARRGTGVARLLLAEAERQIRGAGHDAAWLAVATGNARARRFYERSGWEDAGSFDYLAVGDGSAIHVPCHRFEKRWH